MSTDRPFPLARARDVAAQLELDVGRLPICHACLSFVSLPLHEGDEREAKSWARRMTPDIWEEGLAEPALAALRHACDVDVAGADAALDDLERRGGRSAVARAIVLRLAADQAATARAEMRLGAAARSRLALAPPELN